MISKIESLKRVPIFSSLEEDDLKELAAIAVSKTFRKNKIIFRQGDPGSMLFVITAGAVKVSLIGSQGKEIILNWLYVDDFFGEMSLLDGKFRSATVTTVEETKALIIDRDSFARLIGKKPEFALNILAALNRHLRRATDRIASLSFFDAYGKVAQVLLDLAAKQGIKEKDGESVSLDLTHSRQEMAAMSGLSRETFTRILHEFQTRGYLIVERKKIIIIDETFLRREVI